MPHFMDYRPSLRLSLRSNSLAFNKYHSMADGTGPEEAHKTARPALGPNCGNTGVGSSSDPDFSQQEIRKPLLGHTYPTKVKSLIPAVSPKAQKPQKSRKLHRSPSPSVASLSSVASKKRKITTPLLGLEALPLELQDQVFALLDQTTLLNLAVSSRALSEAAIIALYHQPQFASTYRFAQFVHLVTRSQAIAEMVHILDLSHFQEGLDPEMKIAGWREWKYRDHPLYSIHQKNSAQNLREESTRGSISRACRAIGPSFLPKPNPYLAEWNTCRDIPIGAVIHAIESCRRLRHLDLSDVFLAPDYLVASSVHVSSTNDGLTFMSDLPKFETWHDEDTRTCDINSIVKSITGLTLLRTLRIENAFWLHTEDVRILLRNNPHLELVNLCGSGMKHGMAWAGRGKPSDILGFMID